MQTVEIETLARTSQKFYLIRFRHEDCERIYLVKKIAENIEEIQSHWKNCSITSHQIRTVFLSPTQGTRFQNNGTLLPEVYQPSQQDRPSIVSIHRPPAPIFSKYTSL